MSIGERIKRVRKHRGLSQAELAGLTGVSRGACGQWEAGLSLPSVEKLSKLAVLLEARFEWLVTGRGEMEYVCGIEDEKAGSTEHDFFLTAEQRELLTHYARLSAKSRNTIMDLLRIM